MSIINTNYKTTPIASTNNLPFVNGKKTKDVAENEGVATTDVFVKGDKTGSVTYSKPVSNVVKNETEPDKASTINQLIIEQEERVNSFRNMIMEMISKQGEKSNLTLFNQKLTVSPADSLKAQQAIGEEGEYGIDAVASRIMDMAEGFIGKDSQMFSTIKNAVLQGYSEAEKAWGGKLPGICGDTLTEINKRFDKLEGELFSSYE